MNDHIVEQANKQNCSLSNLPSDAAKINGVVLSAVSALALAPCSIRYSTNSCEPEKMDF